MEEFQASKVFLQLFFQQTYLQALLATFGGGGGGVVRRRKNGCGQPARIGLKKRYFEEQIFWVLVSPLLRGSI